MANPLAPTELFTIRRKDFSILHWDRVINDTDGNFISPVNYQVFRTENSNGTGFYLVKEVTETVGIGDMWLLGIEDTAHDLQFKTLYLSKLDRTIGRDLVDQIGGVGGETSLGNIGGLVTLAPGDFVAQTFTPKQKNFSGVVLNIQTTALAATVGLQIVLREGDDPNTGAFLGNKSVTTTTLSDTIFTEIPILFDSSVTLEPGRFYSFVLHNTGATTVRVKATDTDYAGDLATTFIDPNDMLTINQFFYKIKAIDVLGNESDFSAESTSIHFKDLADVVNLPISQFVETHGYFDSSEFDKVAFF